MKNTFVKLFLIAAFAVAPFAVFGVPPPAAASTVKPAVKPAAKQPSPAVAAKPAAKSQPVNPAMEACMANAQKISIYPIYDIYRRTAQIRATILSVVSKKASLTSAEIKAIEDEILKNVAQEELDKLLDFKASCRFDYISGIHCPKSTGMTRLYAMYDAALKKSGRKVAYEMFKKTNGETTLDDNSHLYFSEALFIAKNFNTAKEAIDYMNDELYWNVDSLAKIIARELIILKQRQLIDNGYSVTYKLDRGVRTYSDGAELLFTYCNQLVDAFNAPYFLGLNARLAEVGHKSRFNNKKLINVNDAKILSKKILYGEVSLTHGTKWMFRITSGVTDCNEVIERINNGSEILKKAAEQPASRNAIIK